MQSLKSKMLKGLIWTQFSNIASKAINFIVTIILARLLMPKDFGLISISYIFIGLISLFSSGGFDTAIVQRKKINKLILSTAFFFVLFSNIIFYAILYFIAPIVSIFYGEKILVSILRALSITLIISALGTIPARLLERDLKFKKMFYSEIIAILCYAIVAVLMVLNGFGVWSIVYGQIILQIVQTIIFWIVSPIKLAFYLDFKVIKELFYFGKEIVSSSFITFILLNLDNALVGKVLGSKQLGFYSLAYNITSIPATNVTNIFSRVAFPIYSKFQNEKEKLKKIYLKVVKLTSLLVFPLTFVLLIFARQFITLAYGEKWLPMLHAFQILCIYGMIRAFGSNSGTFLFGVGKPSIVKKSSFWTLMGVLILIYPFTKMWGIMGTALIILLSAIPTATWTIIQTLDIIRTKAREYLNCIFPSFFIALITVSSFKLIKLFFVSSESLILYLILVILIAISYIFLLLIFDKSLTEDIKEVVQLINIR